MIRIKIEGKNIADIWSLACVRTIAKTPDGDIYVTVTQTDNIGETYSNSGIIGNTIETESEKSIIGRIIYQED